MIWANMPTDKRIIQDVGKIMGYHREVVKAGGAQVEGIGNRGHRSIAAEHTRARGGARVKTPYKDRKSKWLHAVAQHAQDAWFEAIRGQSMEDVAAMIYGNVVDLTVNDA